MIRIVLDLIDKHITDPEYVKSYFDSDDYMLICDEDGKILNSSRGWKKNFNNLDKRSIIKIISKDLEITHLYVLDKEKSLKSLEFFSKKFNELNKFFVFAFDKTIDYKSTNIEVVNNRNIGIWDYDIENDVLTWDDSMYHIHDVENKNSIDLNFKWMVDNLYNMNFEELIKDTTQKTSEKLVQILTLKNENKLIKISYKRDGRFIIGTCVEWSNQVLHFKHQDLIELFVKNLPIATGILNPDLKLLYANDLWYNTFKINYNGNKEFIDLHDIPSEINFNNVSSFKIYNKLGQKIQYHIKNIVLDGKVFYLIFNEQYNHDELSRKLEEKQKTIEKIYENREEFLSMLSYEIRTPMNAIALIIEMLINNNTSKEQLEYLKKLKNSSQNLMDILKDLLKFSENETEIDFEQKPSDLFNLFTTLLSNHQLLSEELGLFMFLDYDESLHRKYRFDVNKLNHILSNFLNNSFKFTETGGVMFRVKLLEKKENLHKIRIEIEDSGKGIKDENLNFLQGINDHRTGLGLSINSILLKQLKSNIQYKSKVNGSIFWFDLELKPVFTKKLQKGDDNFNSSLKKCNILVVEDDNIAHFILKKILDDWDVQYEIIQDGKDAFQSYLTKDYDFILVDIFNPTLNGFDLIDTIYKTNKYKNDKIPIVTMSAMPYTQLMNEVKKYNVDFLQKPIDSKLLKSKIHTALYKLNSNRTSNEDKQIVKNHKKDLDVVEDIFEKLISSLRTKNVEKSENQMERLKTDMKFWHLGNIIKQVDEILEHIKSNDYDEQETEKLIIEIDGVKEIIKKNLKQFNL